jgi:hypothetical protein
MVYTPSPIGAIQAAWRLLAAWGLDRGILIRSRLVERERGKGEFSSCEGRREGGSSRADSRTLQEGTTERIKRE